MEATSLVHDTAENMIEMLSPADHQRLSVLCGGVVLRTGLLPPGRYRVTFEHEGQPSEKLVEVKPGAATVLFP